MFNFGILVAIPCKMVKTKGVYLIRFAPFYRYGRWERWTGWHWPVGSLRDLRRDEHGQRLV